MSEWGRMRISGVAKPLFLLFRKQQVKSSSLFTGFQKIPFRRGRADTLTASLCYTVGSVVGSFGS